jgi:glycoprotein-N-acetylgalactosamine 3-beta-galactosyltransferase
MVNFLWAKECDKFIFVARLNSSDSTVSREIYDQNLIPILEPADYIIENYRSLTNKVFSSLKYISEKYPNFDWYLKADDDTFIFVDNLKKFVENKNSSDAVTYGYDVKHLSDNFTYHSGGASYLLSNEALKLIGDSLRKNYTYCSNTGIEDVDVAKCLNKLGVKQNKSIDEDNRERFHPYDVKIHMKGLFGSWINAAAINPLKIVSLFFQLIINNSSIISEIKRVSIVVAILQFHFIT